MKKILISDDKTVTKIVHDDDSETAIKTISSCDTCINDDGTFSVNDVERNKYSIFISDSAGCYMKCKFCYLTLKDMKFKKLSLTGLYDNLVEAIVRRRFSSVLQVVGQESPPPVHHKFVKLCWMGMGDAFLNSHRVVSTTEKFMDYLMESNSTVGLDGVDLSTVMPPVHNVTKELNRLKELDKILQKYPLNPHNDVLVHRNAEFGNAPEVYPSRSRFRLFYSLHSAVQETRDNLIPNAMPLDKAIPALLEYSENNKYNVIFHHMFIDGFNDTDEEIDALIKLIDDYDLYNYEIRILRYNTCEVSTFLHESDNFKNIIKRLVDVHPHIKVQVSAGSEVKAACGQFLTNN